MNILVVDTETTGPNPKTDRIWELAIVKTDKNWNDVSGYVARMWAEDYPDISPDAQRVCGIPESRLTDVPRTDFVMNTVAEMFKSADVVVAYNVQFDRTIIEAECARWNIELPKVEWLCGLEDVEYPKHFRCKQLSHLALDHGIKVDPTGLHGALADCQLFLELMQKGGYSVDKMIEYKNMPWVYLVADLPKPWGSTERLAKKLQEDAKADGYSWQVARGTSGPVFPKKWIKRIKQSQLEAEKAKKLSFLRSVENDKTSEAGQDPIY